MIHCWTNLACAALAVSSTVTAIGSPAAAAVASPKDKRTAPKPFVPNNDTPLPHNGRSASADRRLAVTDTVAAAADDLDNFLDALRVLQDAYFEPWLGTWPKAIDWTAAVTGTHVAAALSSLSGTITSVDDVRAKENLITTYFSQLLSYYFGQDAFAIRNEAFDDMLWVVLGWLETVQFIDYHAALYGTSGTSGTSGTAVRAAASAAAEAKRAQDMPAGQAVQAAQDISEILHNQTWYGNLWLPAFSHRARIFWDLAAKGWNTTLCGGGMIWNPRLEPYKNAITNELFIAASASMYLYFPGDDNPSPYINPNDPGLQDPDPDSGAESAEPHEQKHLRAAMDGYRWLVNSGMTDAQGLYTDGFHIAGWSNVSHPGTQCNVRNDMVYTYNQGVLLTGQMGLWKVTGDDAYLRDGHNLIRAVVNATGYDLLRDQPVDNVADLKPGQLPPWHGLGRAGVLEDQCDVTGQCSQDSQTFKGIFFHHLSAFCAPLDSAVASRGLAKPGQPKTSNGASNALADFHHHACSNYLGWIRHNAAAVLGTKDADGKFGMWWTAGLITITADQADTAPKATRLTAGNSNTKSSVDYRTFGVPNDNTWVSAPAHAIPAPPQMQAQVPLNGRLRDKDKNDAAADQQDEKTVRAAEAAESAGPDPAVGPDSATGNSKTKRSPYVTVPGGPTDPNNRGRGRTVETQGGGLAVLRCLHEIAHFRNGMSE